MMALGLCRTHAIAAIAGATVDSKRWHLHSHTNLVSKTASDSLLLAYMQLLDSNYAIRTLQPYIVLYCHTLTKTVFLDGWMEDGICGPCFSVKLTSSPAPTHGKPSLRFHFISLPFLLSICIQSPPTNQYRPQRISHSSRLRWSFASASNPLFSKKKKKTLLKKIESCHDLSLRTRKMQSDTL